MRLPRHAKLADVLALAERIYAQARVRRADPALRPIERLAAGAHASGELARLRGQRVWFDAAPRVLVPRGRVRFSPPTPATAPAAARQAEPVIIDLTDIIITTKSGHLVIVQMPARRAASIQPGTGQYFSGRIARLRRIAPGRWEVWVRHSRVPRRVDRWPHTFPDYSAYGKPTTAPARP